MQRFFITGTGTGVGKTLVTAALAWQLRREGKSVKALKPIISGYTPDDAQSDAALLLKSCGMAATETEAISPWRYRLPLSPDMAAEKEKKEPVELDELVKFCDTTGNADFRLVEGIGGVMSPINHRHTVLDWMVALGWPVMVVTGSYLGTISHTLTALEAIRARGLAVKALVISESEAGVPLDDTAATLEKFLLKTIPIVKLFRLAAQDDVWKQVSPLSGLCE